MRAMGICAVRPHSSRRSLVKARDCRAASCRAQPSSRPAAGRPAARGRRVRRRRGELQTGPATIPPHWSRYKYPETIPEGATYYIVVRGDTLWDISERFLGNPYLWPQIWDQNRYITDAHWIYPGDPLIIPDVALVTDRRRRSRARATGMEAPSGDRPPRPSGRSGVTDALIPAIEETALQCAHYVVDDREDESLQRRRLRGRRDQDRLRRPRHPVPEQGQQRRA